MATDQHTERPTKEQLETEIGELRQDLGATVTALSEKLDVKSRASRRIRSTSPAVRAAVVAAALGIVGLVVWRRRS
jgi:hypothetical protein